MGENRLIPERLPPFDLSIRLTDGKCRATRNGKPITRWLKDGMTVLDAVRRKERKS